MTEPFADALRTLARYNRFANDRLYDAIAQLPDAERKADRGAFFRSIHATLNHILVGDRIWMARFTGKPQPYTRLDIQPFEDFGMLRAARREEDAGIEQFFATVSPAFLERSLRWKSLAGADFEKPVAITALHLFNHQTHHRGQVHDLLCQAGRRDVVLDLIQMPPAP